MRFRETIIIASLLASILIVWLLVMPAYTHLKESQKLIEQKTLQLSELKNYVTRLEALVAEYKRNQEEIDKFYKFLPQDKDLANFLNQMEVLNARAGLIMRKVDFQYDASVAQKDEEVSETAKLKTVKVDLLTAGSYSALKSFLLDLERNIRLTDVQSISFATSPGQPDIFDFNLSGTAYYID